MKSFFSKKKTAGVISEILAIRPLAEEYIKILSDCANVADYLSKSNAPKEYKELLKLLPDGPLKILDIGCGRGESSLFLSSVGHQVFSVEPSEDFCKLIESAASKFGLPVTVCNGVAEDLDRLDESGFDAVFFNASLHHCDDPTAALCHSYSILRPGGYILLVNELFIRPWVSKTRWYRRLETHPVEMGHYGGNEHAYYSSEYRSLLRNAGFEDLRVLPMASRLDSIHRLLSYILSMSNNESRIKSEIEVLFRAVYYVVLSRILRIAPIFWLCSYCSIFATNYISRKPLFTL